MAHLANESALSKIAAAGRPSAEIVVTFSPKFLALLSEHLYPSANKAFEELITNSWDADAGNVYVRVAANLKTQNAAISILDDGMSMDVTGLQQLWTIAESNKRADGKPARKRIGKFGIGKLATYLLCNELTYICKYNDGIIRIVTMDFRQIDGKRTASQDSMRLSVRELNEKDLASILAFYETGSEVYRLIAAKIPTIHLPTTYFDEYGGTLPPSPAKKNTWTLAILTSLKTGGQQIELGRTQYMLRTALPLASTMKIDFNGTVIVPSKSSVSVKLRWTIGPQLPFDEIEAEGRKVKFTKHVSPVSHIILPGIGEVSGNATLFKESIATGKSGLLESSNGCFVNILGRVINVNGEGQFSVGESGRGTFAKFRATVRMDGLDKWMTIQRDALVEGPEVDLAKAFLVKLFNLARQAEERANAELIEAASRVRKGKLTALPFNNVAAVLQSQMEEGGHLPVFFAQAAAVVAGDIEAWMKETEMGQAGALEGYDEVDEDPKNYLATYDLALRRIRLNKNHPFYVEHSVTEAQLGCLEDMVAVHVLSDAYLRYRGVETAILNDMIAYRDACERTVAQIRRNSPVQIIQLLKAWGSDSTPLEEIVGDALWLLGFKVDRLAKKGEPDGIATAFVSPKVAGKRRKYSFNYDTKATIHEKVTTGNTHMAALKRHRLLHKCNFTLLVGREFQKGALEEEARDNEVTPISTAMLGDLIGLYMGYGLLSLETLEGVFQQYSPAGVQKWIDELKASLATQQHLDMGKLVTAIRSLESHEQADILTCSVIARRYRDLIEDTMWPNAHDVSLVLQGLSSMVPQSLRIDPVSDKVFLLTAPDQIVTEITRQAHAVPGDVRYGILKTV